MENQPNDGTRVNVPTISHGSARPTRRWLTGVALALLSVIVFGATMVASYTSERSQGEGQVYAHGIQFAWLLAALIIMSLLAIGVIIYRIVDRQQEPQSKTLPNSTGVDSAN